MAFDRRTESLAKVELECHPFARIAYDKSCLYRRQFPASFGTDLLQVMQSSDPLCVVKTSRRLHYQFISGWHWLDACRQAGVTKIDVVIVGSKSDEDIEQSAWSYLLSCILKSPHRDNVLAAGAEIISAMPKSLAQILLGDHDRRTSIASVQSLSGETRAAVRNQIARQKRPSADFDSLLDDILRE